MAPAGPHGSRRRCAPPHHEDWQSLTPNTHLSPGALAAIARGRKTDEANSLELLYNLYEARIRGYLENPPPEDWNGAFALLTK